MSFLRFFKAGKAQEVNTTNGLPVQLLSSGSSEITLQNAAAANGNGTALTVAGYGAVGLQISGTFNATVNFEGTVDGTNWVAVLTQNKNNGERVTSATAVGLFVVSVTGLKQFRARVSNFVSGNVTVKTLLVSQTMADPAANISLSTGSIAVESVTLGAGTALAGKMVPVDADGDEKFTSTNPAIVTLSGSNLPLVAGTAEIGSVKLGGHTLVEQKTQADASNNVITFSANIYTVEIYHEEDTWQDFIVNGLTLKVPSGGYRTPIGGVAAATVTIPASVDCLVGRLV